MTARRRRSAESEVYRGLRVVNDAKAIRNGRIGRRIGRRVYGRLAGRLAGRIFGGR